MATLALLPPIFCSYCDACRNWQRESKMSLEWNYSNGDKWKFEKIIAILGISIDVRGYVKATLKAYKKVGRKFRRRRGWITLRCRASYGATNAQHRARLILVFIHEVVREIICEESMTPPPMVSSE
jgi:hypothetical protein